MCKQTENRILTVKRRLISFAILMLHFVVCSDSCEPRSKFKMRIEEEDIESIHERNSFE